MQLTNAELTKAIESTNAKFEAAVQEMSKGGLKMKPEYIRNEPGQILAHLTEECGEVLAAAGKSMRWGLDSYNPELPPEQREFNIDWLRREIADLEAVIARVKLHIFEAQPELFKFTTLQEFD